MGIILSGATMMAAYVGVPRQLHTEDGGAHGAAFSWHRPLKNPSSYRTYDIREAANQALTAATANNRMKSNVSGLNPSLDASRDGSRVDTSNCEAFPPEKMNSHTLPEGMYRIYLPLGVNDGRGVAENSTNPIEVFRCSVGGAGRNGIVK
jgi:hypothetical protein